MMIIGFAAFFGLGVAVPHSYRIAFDAFNVNLPYDPNLHYLLIAGVLAGNLVMGLAAFFARKIGPYNMSPEPEKAMLTRAWLGQRLEALGLLMILLGFLIGIGVIALVAFFLIVVGTILVPVGYVVRKFWH
jgi:hypothetical protein